MWILQFHIIFGAQRTRKNVRKIALCWFSEVRFYFLAPVALIVCSSVNGVTKGRWVCLAGRGGGRDFFEFRNSLQHMNTDTFKGAARRRTKIIRNQNSGIKLPREL